MTNKTIDEIMQGLNTIGHSATLAELARILERHLTQSELAQLVDRAHFEADSRDRIESMLAVVRKQLLEEARDGINAAERKATGLCFESSPATLTTSRTGELGMPMEATTVLGLKAFANFVADIDEQHAPIVLVEAWQRRDDNRCARAVLLIPHMLECLSVLTGATAEAVRSAGRGQYFRLARLVTGIEICVENDGIRYEIAFDPAAAFSIAALLSAQVRKSMPSESQRDLPWLIEHVMAPLQGKRCELGASRTSFV